MSGGDPSKTGDSENFSCLNMNWQALQWAHYPGSRDDIKIDPHNKSNADILSKVCPSLPQDQLHMLPLSDQA